MKSSHSSTNRPSLASTAYSNSTADSPRRMDTSNDWEESDIRRDLASGWGGSNVGASAAAAPAPPAEAPANDWGWKLHTQAVRPLPPFYPLDPRSTRWLLLTHDLSKPPPQQGGESGAGSGGGGAISYAEGRRLSFHRGDFESDIECAEWDNGVPCATLLTMEMVEMVISMYLGGDEGGMMLGGKHAGMVHSIPPTPGPQVLLIELQRRKGDIVTFYNYRRAILDAAEGKFDMLTFDKRDGLEKPGGRDRGNQPRATMNRPTLSRPTSLRPPSLRPPSLSANDADTISVSQKDNTDSQNEIVDKALEALNIAASLIKKDRVDARRLGMESLEDLAMGLENDDDLDTLFDESAGLGIRETILEMIMGDDFEGKIAKMTFMIMKLIESLWTPFLIWDFQQRAYCGAPYDERSRSCTDKEDRKPSPVVPSRRRAATEPVNRPSDMNVPKRFIDDTSASFGCDVLSSLIRILGQAKSKPHDAYHSARCLDVLFKGGGNSHRARARRDLDAKRIISAALEVGARSHAKLADASREALVALVTDDENSSDEQEEKSELEQQQQGDDENEDMENAEGGQRLP
ncbi:hypothetical protein HJC23_007926 [Cyclotella cryptica]|uniref:Uncharacterized protein n=1 Tax=Cyclotella cryptica TaxID=29204 RepID=A0ABD3NYQ4_9STRA